MAGGTPPLDYWPPLPEGVTGQQIRRRRIAQLFDGPVRVGGAEPMVIVGEADGVVVYSVYSSFDGRELETKGTTRDEFERTFERKREAPVTEKAQTRTRVYVGERDISPQVLAVDVHLRPGELGTATLVVAIEPLHVDADGTLVITIPEES